MAKHRRPKKRAAASPSAPVVNQAFFVAALQEDDSPAPKPLPIHNSVKPLLTHAAPATIPDLPRPLHLLGLPYDVVTRLFSSRILPPTALIELACASKAAANAALPELYSTLYVGSFFALPRLCATLQARSDLAQHTRTLFGGSELAIPLHFERYMAEMNSVSVQPGSPIVSVAKARQRGIGCSDRFPREMLLMPWFVHVATLCPNLVSVDISKVTMHTLPNHKGLYLGLLDLAAILGPRGGRFASHHLLPFSSILANNFLMDKPVTWHTDVFFVYAIDWGKRQVDVSSRPATKIVPDGNEFIVPFRDLVGSLDYGQWTLRDVHLATAHRMANPRNKSDQARGHVYQWINNPRRLWTNAGLSRTEDHAFDFAKKPSVIKGDVTVYSHFFAMVDGVLSLVNVDPRRNTALYLNGSTTTVDPDFVMEPRIVKGYQDMFGHLRTHAKPWVTSLFMDLSTFIDYTTAPELIACIAEGLPNLTNLGMIRTNCPLDFVLYHMDPLLRRDAAVGKRLKNLMVSVNVSNTVGHFAQHSTAVRFPLKRLKGRRSSLAADRENPGHLETLTLQVDGPGLHLFDDRSLMPPTVAIHPGLIHGLTLVCLKQVYLYLLPMRMAQPLSPSFSPIDHVCDSEGSLFTRTMVSFSHRLCLPHLRSLTLTSNAALPSLVPVSHFHELIPRCPNLEVLRFMVDGAHATRYAHIWSALSILEALQTFPKLIHATFQGFSRVDDDSMAMLKRVVFGVYPRECRPCPRLSHLIVNEYMFDLHELELEWDRREGTAVELIDFEFTPTSVEAAGE